MKIYLILIAAILMIGMLSCTSMSQEDKDAYNANVARTDFVLEEARKTRAMIAQGDLDAEQLLALNTSLINAYIEIDALTVSNKALSEKTGLSEPVMMGLSIASSLLGVRFMRGGASKGHLANAPLLGKGSSSI